MSGTEGEMRSDEEMEESWPSTRGYSSPPCMLHELDPTFVERSERTSASARLPAANAAQDWEEVRLWRKAQRSVLIERRLAMPATERAARSEAITAALTEALPCHPAPARSSASTGRSRANTTRDDWFGPCMPEGHGWPCPWSSRKPNP